MKPPPPPPPHLADKTRVSKRKKKQQKHASSKNEPPVVAAVLDGGDDVTLTPPKRTVTTSSEQKQNDVQKQRQEQQHASISISISTVDGRTRRHGMSETEAAAASAVAPGEAESTATIAQGGWRRGVRDDDSDSEFTESREVSSSRQQLATETTSRQQDIDMVHAQLVDEENEMQGHAEFLFQQMLAQATVAELVDEDEIRQQAYEQAALELQEQQPQKDQETVTQDHVSINNNNKQQQQRQRLRIILASFLFMAAIIIAIVVVAAVFLQQRVQGDNNAVDLPMSPLASTGGLLPPRALTTMPTNSITPHVIPSFSPSITPSLSFSPSTTPSSMPSAASSWRQIGNSINGMQDGEGFGNELGFSADGNIVVASARGDNGTHSTGHVRAYTYSYHNETDEWKQLGQYIKHESAIDELCLSPNGKFLGVFSEELTGGSMFRIFALSDNKMNVTTEDDDTAAAMFWEQIGPDIVLSLNNQEVRSSSLTDDLILAIGFYNQNTYQGLIYTYQFDANQSDWIRMGQEIQMSTWSWSLASMQLVRNKSTGTLVLAVGWSRSVHTFRYEPDTDSWVRFGGLELALKGDEEKNSGFDEVYISLSMDGETLVGGFEDIDTGPGIGLLRTFSYDAATDDWIQLGKDLNDSSFLFGHSFSLSANGKVLVATTQTVDNIILAGGMTDVYGQVRTWDFIADDQQGVDGEWIQRGEAVLEVGTLDSEFGRKVALSADGIRLATSAVLALNEQGAKSGKVWVFEQY